MNRYQDTQNTQTAEPFMVESHVPVGASRMETHVFVPAAQALITMILIAADVLLWQWHPIAGAVGAAGLLMWGWRILLGDRLLWKLETITGRELDGQPGLGKPGPLALLNPEQARRTVATQETQTSDLPRMRLFVTRCFLEGPSETDQHIHPNTAERTNYVELRDGLMGLGLARWRNPANPKAGWDLVLDREQTLAMVEKHVR